MWFSNYRHQVQKRVFIIYNMVKFYKYYKHCAFEGEYA